MWNRTELKERAKNVLRTSYWKAFLVSILIIIATFSVAGSDRNEVEYKVSNFEFSLEFFMVMIFVSLFSILLLICFRVFIGFNLEVGCRKYFIKSAEGEVNLNYLGYTFKKESYLNVIVSIFVMNLLLFLWFLLLIIPGIIKTYSYRFVPYILADNPGMDSLEAIDLSKKMTKGHKFDLFVLDLSFILWVLLGLICFGIGILFVAPYYNATYAEVYVFLRKKAVDNNNIVTMKELNINEKPNLY